MLDAGDLILRFQSQQNRKIAEAGAFELALELPAGATSIPGADGMIAYYRWRAIALNTPLFSSQSFEGAWDPERHDVMVAFAKMATGKWKVSLYTDKPTVNCGGIAKTFGGGGHAQAAGFVCDKLPWESR